MALVTSAARSARRRCALAGLGALLACGGPSEDGSASKTDEPVATAGEIGFESVEEMRLELETLDHEIRGLDEYLVANPAWTPPDPADTDPRAVLEAARSTRDAAGSALAAADTASAADSLRAASARIEHVKRLLGVAEEMGVDFAADSLPPAE